MYVRSQLSKLINKNMRIEPEQFYTVNEAVDMGLSVGKSKDVRKQMLLRAVRSFKVPAKNLGSERQPRYVILGKDLIHYRKSYMRPGTYVTK